MKEQLELTDDQLARIEATLKRIRGGLSKFTAQPAQEPAHFFVPEVCNAK